MLCAGKVCYCPTLGNCEIMRKQNTYFVLCIGLVLGCFSGILYRWLSGGEISCLRISLSDSILPSAPLTPEDWLKIDPFDIIDLPDKDIGELGNGSFLMFVGVMTSNDFLSTRAIAVYETWGHHLPGKLAFFTSENSSQPEKYPNLPVIRLKGVDDVYPPQLKAYEMLRFMWKNFGRYFQWFLRIDDDAYLRMERIADMVNSLDSTIPVSYTHLDVYKRQPLMYIQPFIHTINAAFECTLTKEIFVKSN